MSLAAQPSARPAASAAPTQKSWIASNWGLIAAIVAQEAFPERDLGIVGGAKRPQLLARRVLAQADELLRLARLLELDQGVALFEPPAQACERVGAQHHDRDPQENLETAFQPRQGRHPAIVIV